MRRILPILVILLAGYLLFNLPASTDGGDVIVISSRGFTEYDGYGFKFDSGKNILIRFPSGESKTYSLTSPVLVDGMKIEYVRAIGTNSIQIKIM